jgi:hypothetical protein
MTKSNSQEKSHEAPENDTSDQDKTQRSKLDKAIGWPSSVLRQPALVEYTKSYNTMGL